MVSERMRNLPHSPDLCFFCEKVREMEKTEGGLFPTITCKTSSCVFVILCLMLLLNRAQRKRRKIKPASLYFPNTSNLNWAKGIAQGTVQHLRVLPRPGDGSQDEPEEQEGSRKLTWLACRLRPHPSPFRPEGAFLLLSSPMEGVSFQEAPGTLGQSAAILHVSSWAHPQLCMAAAPKGTSPSWPQGQGVHSTPPALRHPLSPPQTPSRPSRLQGARAHAGPSGHTSFPSSLLEDLGILGVRVTQSLWDLSVGSQSCVLLCCYIYSEESVVLCPEVIRPLSVTIRCRSDLRVTHLAPPVYCLVQLGAFPTEVTVVSWKAPALESETVRVSSPARKAGV